MSYLSTSVLTFPKVRDDDFLEITMSKKELMKDTSFVHLNKQSFLCLI